MKMNYKNLSLRRLIQLSSDTRRRKQHAVRSTRKNMVPVIAMHHGVRYKGRLFQCTARRQLRPFAGLLSLSFCRERIYSRNKCYMLKAKVISEEIDISKVFDLVGQEFSLKYWSRALVKRLKMHCSIHSFISCLHRPSYAIRTPKTWPTRAKDHGFAHS